MTVMVLPMKRPETFFADSDGDGFGDANVVVESCERHLALLKTRTTVMICLDVQSCVIRDLRRFGQHW